jgi:hypothetical protein
VVDTPEGPAAGLRLDPGRPAGHRSPRRPPGTASCARRTGPRALVERLSDAHVTGGASDDGRVGLTAAAHGEVLPTRGARAAVASRVPGVPYRLLADR